MKKSMMVMVLVALGLFMMAIPANAYFAINTHGGWGTSTAGCADCHTTHAASAAFLLASGPSQTDACYACHGNGATLSPYDVYNGAMSTNYTYPSPVRTYWTSGSIYPSYSGGFQNSYMFNRSTNNDAAALADESTNFGASTSAHNVEEAAIGNIPGTAWNSTNNIPGATFTLTGNIFKCGSCHDPHGGANSNATARLLKKQLPGPSDPYNIDFDTAGTVDTNTYRVTVYPESINTWCGGCHDFFDAADGSGHTASSGYYRHPMGVGVTGAVYNNISYGTPLAKTTLELTCFSCHRAHGSAASVSGAAASFKRYNPVNGNGTTGSGSVLLRMNQRDVCYECHQAATVNTYTYYNGGGGSHTW